VISVSEGDISADSVRLALGLVAEDEYLKIIDIIAGGRAGEIFETVTTLADSGVDFGVFLSGLGDIIRAQLAVVLNGRVDGVSARAAAALGTHRDDFTPADLLRMLSILGAIEPQFRRSSQQQLLVEMLLVRFALLDKSIALEEIIATLDGCDSEAQSRARPARVRGASAAFAPGSPSPTPATSKPGVSEIPPVSTAGAPHPPPSRNAGGKAAEQVDWKRGFEAAAGDSTRARLTTEAVQAERLAMLRAQDPVLDAAIDELDLELLD
ncbi:MAG: hypothetical protein H0U59_09245, partial [Gemmatimonadaceae bacterium]|nr:hypothetical protein [Gemmatimonadaceae bacterium]